MFLFFYFLSSFSLSLTYPYLFRQLVNSNYPLNLVDGILIGVWSIRLPYSKLYHHLILSSNEVEDGIIHWIIICSVFLFTSTLLFFLYSSPTLQLIGYCFFGASLSIMEYHLDKYFLSDDSKTMTNNEARISLWKTMGSLSGSGLSIFVIDQKCYLIVLVSSLFLFLPWSKSHNSSYTTTRLVKNTYSPFKWFLLIFFYNCLPDSSVSLSGWLLNNEGMNAQQFSILEIMDDMGSVLGGFLFLIPSMIFVQKRHGLVIGIYAFAIIIQSVIVYHCNSSSFLMIIIGYQMIISFIETIVYLNFLSTTATYYGVNVNYSILLALMDWTDPLSSFCSSLLEEGLSKVVIIHQQQIIYMILICGLLQFIFSIIFFFSSHH